MSHSLLECSRNVKPLTFQNFLFLHTNLVLGLVLVMRLKCVPFRKTVLCTCLALILWFGDTVSFRGSLQVEKLRPRNEDCFAL